MGQKQWHAALEFVRGRGWPDLAVTFSLALSMMACRYVVTNSYNTWIPRLWFGMLSSKIIALHTPCGRVCTQRDVTRRS